VFPVRYELNTVKLCILPTQCICVFHMVLTVHSDCFPKQHLPVELKRYQCSGYNRATMFMGDISMGTWPSKLGESRI
jgi:hypothetical protein